MIFNGSGVSIANQFSSVCIPVYMTDYHFLVDIGQAMQDTRDLMERIQLDQSVPFSLSDAVNSGVLTILFSSPYAMHYINYIGEAAADIIRNNYAPAAMQTTFEDGYIPPFASSIGIIESEWAAAKKVIEFQSLDNATGSILEWVDITDMSMDSHTLSLVGVATFVLYTAKINLLTLAGMELSRA